MHELYENPLVSRYASKEMSEIFSDDRKFSTWRRLWLALAETQKELGLNITDDQICELRSNLDNINYDYANLKEKELRHDVMAHVYAYGEQCPKAFPIIHLGATSAFVGDNTDIILMIDAMKIIREKLILCAKLLSKFALEYKDMPALSYTHFQPAQLTTVGKRTCLWIHDLLLDLEELEQILDTIKLRGIKGTVGTQASYLSLFEGDHSKVKELEKRLILKLGFNKAYPVTGQTYSRKVDSRVLNLISSIAQSASKFSNDMRLLQGLKELEEPFESNQIGSSAMPYKRNPMRSERITSLARYCIINALNSPMTAATQWFERTLDDSANRRIVIPQSFLAVDAILNIYINIAKGIEVYPKVIAKRIANELPFMATEHILMSAVKRGGNRQVLHEKIRQYSIIASENVKNLGLENNLIELIANDSNFGFSLTELYEILNPLNFVGRASQQVSEYIEEYVLPITKSSEIKITSDYALKV